MHRAFICCILDCSAMHIVAFCLPISYPQVLEESVTRKIVDVSHLLYLFHPFGILFPCDACMYIYKSCTVPSNHSFRVFQSFRFHNLARRVDPAKSGQERQTFMQQVTLLAGFTAKTCIFFNIKINRHF